MIKQTWANQDGWSPSWACPPAPTPTPCRCLVLSAGLRTQAFGEAVGACAPSPRASGKDPAGPKPRTWDVEQREIRMGWWGPREKALNVGLKSLAWPGRCKESPRSPGLGDSWAIVCMVAELFSWHHIAVFVLPVLHGWCLGLAQGMLWEEGVV